MVHKSLHTGSAKSNSWTHRSAATGVASTPTHTHTHTTLSGAINLRFGFAQPVRSYLELCFVATSRGESDSPSSEVRMAPVHEATICCTGVMSCPSGLISLCGISFTSHRCSVQMSLSRHTWTSVWCKLYAFLRPPFWPTFLKRQTPFRDAVSKKGFFLKKEISPLWNWFYVGNVSFEIRSIWSLYVINIVGRLYFFKNCFLGCSLVDYLLSPTLWASLENVRWKAETSQK